jgi:hypothetical protein
MLLMKISPQVYVFPLPSGKVNLGMVTKAVVEPRGSRFLCPNDEELGPPIYHLEFILEV